jgi:hypothetical protein
MNPARVLKQDELESILGYARRTVANGGRVNIGRIVKDQLGVCIHAHSQIYRVVQDALVKERLTYRHRKHRARSRVQVALHSPEPEPIRAVKAIEIHQHTACADLDEFLAAEAEKGNTRALRLLKQRISGK